MISLELRGTPKGAKEGGVLETIHASIEIEVPALAIPDMIRVSVEHLELHGVLHAKDVPLPSNAKLITGPETIICTVRTGEGRSRGRGRSGPGGTGSHRQEEGRRRRRRRKRAQARATKKAAAPAKK